MRSWTDSALSLALALGLLGFGGLSACGDDQAASDVVEDTGAVDAAADAAVANDPIVIPTLDPTRTAYFFKVTPDEGEAFAINRDVTGDGPLVFLFSNEGTGDDLELSFGDAIVTVRLLLVEIDFGVVMNVAGPVDIVGPAPYDFGPTVPTLLLGVDDEDYSSGGPSADGTIHLTEWSDARGGRIAGRINGRLTSDSGAWVDVEGVFNLVLPRDFRQSSDRSCDLLAQDCRPWEACYWVDGPPAPVCRLPGDGRAGEPCAVPEACAPGFICRTGFCRRICLVSQPECNIEYVCEPWYGRAGYCRPPR